VVTIDEHDTATGRPGKVIVGALVLGAALVGIYLATGMLGMDHGASTDNAGPMETMDHNATASMRLDPAAFAARLARPSVFVVNVHTPYEGEIDGTDAFIPYDDIVGAGRLPADKDAEILLYCRSGRMSELAMVALQRAGYTNVVDLAGGMKAWEAAGMPMGAMSST
jgi:rhodanese-related sulfurtransferase